MFWIVVADTSNLWRYCPILDVPCMQSLWRNSLVKSYAAAADDDEDNVTCVEGKVTVFNMANLSGPLQIGDHNVMHVVSGKHRHGLPHPPPSSSSSRRVKPKKQITGKTCSRLNVCL